MDNSQKRILIIEDDQFLREFYQELLQSEGYTIEVAGDGESGFQKAQLGGFDLILLDIMLPKKDGLQILRDLKAQGTKSPNQAIVILTNIGQEAIIKESFNLGVEGFLIKSALNPDQVLTEIRSYLGKNHNG